MSLRDNQTISRQKALALSSRRDNHHIAATAKMAILIVAAFPSRLSRYRRLRRWLPRHLDIDRTSDQDIQEIVLTMNLTPRKCLGFKTPFQALIAELGKDVQIRFS